MDPQHLDDNLERIRRRYINQTPPHQARWEGINLGNTDPTKRGRGRGRHRRPTYWDLVTTYWTKHYVIFWLLICLAILASVACVATIILAINR